MTRALRGIAALALIALAAGCAAIRTTTPGGVGIDRAQRMSVSAQDVDIMAGKQYAGILDEAGRSKLLDTDPAQVNRVREVSRRLVAQTGAFRDDAPGWPWEVHVIESPELNAWCMPGGRVAVYSALIVKLRLTDAELAAVMGHEISHALREHAREKLSQAAGVNAVLGVASSVIGVDVTGVGSQGYELLVGLPNSREMETEADRMGVELMARAGYDPAAAANVWVKIDQASNDIELLQFLSTHPSTRSRIADMRRTAEVVRPLYLLSGKS